jgi:hypothetical protein
MNDIQILTLALTVAVTFIGVMLGVLINNNRLNDVKDLLRAEIRAEGAELRGLIERHHSEMMAKLIEMDNRILRLEE